MYAWEKFVITTKLSNIHDQIAYTLFWNILVGQIVQQVCQINY